MREFHKLAVVWVDDIIQSVAFATQLIRTCTDIVPDFATDLAAFVAPATILLTEPVVEFAVVLTAR